MAFGTKIISNSVQEQQQHAAKMESAVDVADVPPSSTSTSVQQSAPANAQNTVPQLASKSHSTVSMFKNRAMAAPPKIEPPQTLIKSEPVVSALAIPAIQPNNVVVQSQEPISDGEFKPISLFKKRGDYSAAALPKLETIYKLVEAVGQYMNMSVDEIEKIKNKATSPSEASKVYNEYNAIMKRIQEEQNKKNLERQAAELAAQNARQQAEKLNEKAPEKQSEKPVMGAFKIGGERVATPKEAEVLLEGTYEFKYVVGGDVKIIKKNKKDFPDFIYYNGVTAEFVPLAESVFAEEAQTPQKKPQI